MHVKLEFDKTGRIACLWKDELLVAKFLVHGPFKRNAEEVTQGCETTFYGELRDIGDYQYIDEKTHTLRTRPP